LPIPERGVLSRYGYANVKDMPDQKRRLALKRAVDAYGHRKVIGHLVLIANYTRISDPAAYAIFKSDQEHVSRLYKDVKSKSHNKSHKRRSKSVSGSKRRKSRRR
jgi:ABC-type transporter MlaC component